MSDQDKKDDWDVTFPMLSGDSLGLKVLAVHYLEDRFKIFSLYGKEGHDSLTVLVHAIIDCAYSAGLDTIREHFEQYLWRIKILDEKVNGEKFHDIWSNEMEKFYEQLKKASPDEHPATLDKEFIKFCYTKRKKGID